ncbi:MAG: insulinase family protein [Nitrospirae bacterium]|nr:insulinase family protein [Nitrospirota bacterium]MBI3593962.1 insulinase family protein [Nitrospirota bacterium]
MKNHSQFKISLFVLLVFVFLASYGAECRATPPSLQFEPLVFHPPKGKRTELSNGMVLYLLEDHELPLVNISFMVQAGSIYEPADKIGLASMTGALMRTGGAGEKSGDEVDEELEFLSASISIWIGGEAGGGGLNVLTKDFDQGLDLFSDILLHPKFSEEKLQLLKNQEVENIRRKNDNPSSIASREFLKLLYGTESPFARETTLDTISQIKRQDCIEYYSKYFHPDAIILGVAGDFKSEEVIQKLENKFKNWEKRKEMLPEFTPIHPEYKSTVNLVEKDLTQSSIRIGHLGIKQNNPDYFPLSVMNDILGGQAFSSRLFQEVRTRKGLAYSVGTVFNPGNIEVGTFFAFSQTMSKNTIQSVSAILENIKKMRDEPVSAEELRLAKDSFLNSFIFSFTNSAQIVSRQISLEYYHLPEDFMEQFRDHVSKVTREDVLRVAQKYIHPDGMTLLIVGKSSQFDHSLSIFGPVNTIPLTNP